MVTVVVALVLALMARGRPELRTMARTLGALALVTALLPMCAGLVGHWWSMKRAEYGLTVVPVEQREVSLRHAQDEASRIRTAGFLRGCAFLLPAVIALLLVPAKPPAEES